MVLTALRSNPILRSEVSLGPEALKAKAKAGRNLVEPKATAKERSEVALLRELE